jgi:hypothetical protein
MMMLACMCHGGTFSMYRLQKIPRLRTRVQFLVVMMSGANLHRNSGFWVLENFGLGPVIATSGTSLL